MTVTSGSALHPLSRALHPLSPSLHPLSPSSLRKEGERSYYGMGGSGVGSLGGHSGSGVGGPQEPSSGSLAVWGGW